MNNKLRVSQVILVEGRYDATALASMVDGLILTTGGFSIFSDEEKKSLIRTLGKQRGLVILTDSDAAGFRIRHYIEKIAAGCPIFNAYIPSVMGKEKRKASPSKEGTLGVEGLPPAVLRDALLRAGVGAVQESPAATVNRPISHTDLYQLGLSGTMGSAGRKRHLLRLLGLPQRLSKRAMVEVLNSLYSYEELVALAQTKPVLFWDFHGTLTLPDVAWFDAAIEAAAEQVPARPLARDVLEKHFAGTCLPWYSVPGGDTQHLRGTEAWWGHCEREFEAMFQRCGFTGQEAERIAPALREKILQPERYHLRPDAISTLGQLKERGYRNFVLSNNFPELEQVIQALGLSPYLEGVLTSGLVGFDKPRPEIFSAARQAAGNPTQAWMIGDNPRDDIQGGKASGFCAVLINNGSNAGFSSADYQITQLADMVTLLDSLYP